MDKVLFLGGLIPHDEEIIIDTKNFMNAAADAFQMQLINGIEQNGYKPIVISAPFIGSFPINYKKVFYKSKEYADGYCYVSFNNIWGIRNFSRYRGLKKELKKDTYADIKKVIVYSVHTPFARIAKYLKKMNPNTQICLIVPDLPEHMNLREKKSILYRIAKVIDCKVFYNLAKYFDCFCFVSKYQSEKVNKLNKPETIVEGIAKIVEETYSPVDNSKKRIVYTGSLNKQFGIMNLILAVQGMSKDVELILCGSGDAIQEIKKLNDGRIKYLGVLDQVATRKVQLSANVLVNPRTNNGAYTRYSFPSKTIEYLSTGRPVVCYKLDGIPDDYDAHLIFPKDESVEELRQTLDEVLSYDNNQLEKIFLFNTEFIKISKGQKFMVRKIISMFDQNLYLE